MRGGAIGLRTRSGKTRANRPASSQGLPEGGTITTPPYNVPMVGGHSIHLLGRRASRRSAVIEVEHPAKPEFVPSVYRTPRLNCWTLRATVILFCELHGSPHRRALSSQGSTHMKRRHLCS